MKKIRFLLVVLSLVLAGCASIPSKSGADDCLIVVKNVVVNESNALDAMVYQFSLSTGGAPVSNPRHASYFAFVIKEPGVRITQILSRVNSDTGNAVGGEYANPVNIPLPYEPGHAVILDSSFVRVITEPKPHTFSESIGFQQLNQDDRDALIADLQAKKVYDSWEP